MMKRLILFYVIVLSLLAACRPQPETATPAVPTEATTSTAAVLPSPTPTPEPPSTLAVCTAQLPESVFPYAGSQIPSKRNLLTILYEAPLETVGDELLPVILESVPSFVNGGQRLEPVTVMRGQTVVDAEGELAVFQPGIEVRPSGCRGVDCSITWNGETPLQMDQMVVDFTLTEGLFWSDGEPVSADDSVRSFQWADDPQAPGLHWAEDRTDAYKVLDSKTVQWIGRPGFSTADLNPFFWVPLPSYLFEAEQDWSEISESAIWAEAPPSYGPFQIQAREADLIRLSPNLHYFRANEGLPRLDELVFIQVDGGREAGLEALRAGECDLLDSSFGWENDLLLVSQVEQEGLGGIHAQPGESWWQLAFGIVPAAYDDFYNPALGDRPDFFGDPNVRWAIAACLDRQGMLETALGGWGQLWPSFMPPGSSQLTADEAIRFDPEGGEAALEAAGWLDMDGDPGTPRVAVNVSNIPAGTEFRLELLVDTTPFQQDMAAIIQESLDACGIEVTIQSNAPEALYAPGPEGPLFGRRFDLALIAWQPDLGLDCRFYLDQAIPNSNNQWVGTNIPGLAEPEYDQACTTAGMAFGEDRSPAIRAAELAFTKQLQAVPLFSPPEALVISPSLCVDEILTNGKEFFKSVATLPGDKNCP